MSVTETSGRTLLDEVELGSASGRSLTMVGETSTTTRGWDRIHDDARRLAASLRALGVGPGAGVAVVGSTSFEVVTTVQATWLAGGVLTILPVPGHVGSRRSFPEHTRRLVASTDSALVLAHAPVVEELGEALDRPVVELERLVTDGGSRSADGFDPAPVRPDDPALLQFTSGSTTDPKGVVLTHANIVANTRGIIDATEIDPDRDRGVSWLPLYHDMGFIGFLCVPMVSGGDVLLAPTDHFVGRPRRWLEWISEFRATVSGGPNFAYTLAQMVASSGPDLDLSSWRIAFNGAEPIDTASFGQFFDALAPYGMSPRASYCAYGLAEATVAVTLPRPGTGLLVDRIDRATLAAEGVARPATGSGTSELAVLGRPVGDLEVTVVDPGTGTELPARCAGEIRVRGSSVMSGYHRAPDATAAALRDGWLHTGDIGYWTDDGLVVCGRAKETIIVGGRNILPQDIERAALAAVGLEHGLAAAFPHEPDRLGETFVVVVEARHGSRPNPEAEVTAAVREEVGATPAEVVMVRPGRIPRTSSGKVQRDRCRQMYLDRTLATP
jgi:fatty-acyl-CoA synthase